MKSYCPIALFVYKRPDKTLKVLEGLQSNSILSKSNLFVFQDGLKSNPTDQELFNHNEVFKIIGSFKGAYSKHIVRHESNLGLAKSLTSGISDLLRNHESVIILEDDIVPSMFFLEYMNLSLFLYKDNPKVGSVSAYSYPVKNNNLPSFFFLNLTSSWGWGTWSRAWNQYNPDGKHLRDLVISESNIGQFNFNNTFDFMSMLEDCINGKNDSWGVRWYASCYLSGLLTLYPKFSLVNNIGHDNSGTHCGNTSRYEVVLDRSNDLTQLPVEAKLSLKAKKKIEDYFTFNEKDSLINRFKIKIGLK